jgi:AraC-like DNA-binding protein
MTPWLKSLLKQYFYETVIMLDSPPGCTFFLEKQIINEVMRCLFSNYYMKNDELDKVVVDSQVFEIIKYIESHLHEENLSVVKIAQETGLSESSLLRKFKASLGTSPQSYIKNRRLEDAYQFIKEHKVSVSEACFMVGYSDFASFSKSFKTKFGILPSHL